MEVKSHQKSKVWWNRTALEKRFGIKTERKEFHSFRHSCTDACYENGVNSKFVTQFLGQKHGELSLDRYASDAHVETMYKECNNKFSLQGFKWSQIEFQQDKDFCLVIEDEGDKKQKIEIS